MTPDQLTQLKLDTEAVEGRTSWLYLDANGNATCGVGHEVISYAEAAALPFSPSVTLAEWTRFKAAPKGCIAGFYRAYLQGRLSDPDIDALLNADIAEAEKEVAGHFADYPTWPAPAQYALLDMTFNLGWHELLNGFPHLCAAACAEAWPEAAQRCHRLGISSERNRRTAQLFIQAAELAQ